MLRQVTPSFPAKLAVKIVKEGGPLVYAIKNPVDLVQMEKKMQGLNMKIFIDDGKFRKIDLIEQISIFCPKLDPKQVIVLRSKNDVEREYAKLK